MSRLNGFTVYIRQSGDGFELLDANGNVVVWTLSKTWALKILLAFELLEGSDNSHHHDDK